MTPDDPLSVSDFVGLLNEAYDMAFPSITIRGEILNLRVSKNRWVYFDLKDDTCSLKCFGTVHQLPGPVEDGMMLEVRGNPNMHDRYGFSFNVQAIRPTGEGSLKRAAELLAAQLQKEGLFEDSRKRQLPYPPRRIGLITSRASAAYADFTKIIDARWGGLKIDVVDVQVQGEPAVAQIVAAIARFNGLAVPPEILVLIRGGGSPDDLAAFSSEQVTRAVAASGIPTLVAIGHEIDVSLAELAADKRASTPSNAAELLTPDKMSVLAELQAYKRRLRDAVEDRLLAARDDLSTDRQDVGTAMQRQLNQTSEQLGSLRSLLTALSPQAALSRGYAVLRGEDGSALSPAATSELRSGDSLLIELKSQRIKTIVQTNEAI